MIRLSPILAIALAALLTSAAGAGPLNPPAGAVTSTYKPLTDVEPRTAVNATNTPANSQGWFTITQPGSYYLTGDILCNTPGLTTAIQIIASNVTLDLNGFHVGGSAVTNGIDIISSNATVRNGSITGLSTANAVGIRFTNNTIASTTLRDLSISLPSTALSAIYHQGSNLTIDNCVVTGSRHGIYNVSIAGSSDSRILNTQVSNCTDGVGIEVGIGSIIENCVVQNIARGTLAGSHAISCSHYGVVRNCTIIQRAATSAQTIISAGDRARIEGNHIVVVNGPDVTAIASTLDGLTIRNNSITFDAATPVGLGIDLSTPGSGSHHVMDNDFHNLTICLSIGSGARNTIIRNSFSSCVNGIVGTALPSNIIGPTAGNGNPTASTNPHANFYN